VLSVREYCVNGLHRLWKGCGLCREKGRFCCESGAPRKMRWAHFAGARFQKLVMEDLAQHVRLNFIELPDGGFQSGSSVERGPDEQFMQTKGCMADEDLSVLELVRVVEKIHLDLRRVALGGFERL